MKRSYTKRPGLKSVDRGIRQVAPTFGKTAFVTHGAKARGAMAVESDAERLVINVDAALADLDPSHTRLDIRTGMAEMGRYKYRR